MARFDNPLGVAVDGAGNIYVADQQNHAIRKITPAGVVTTLAGWPGKHGSADGTGSAARFNFPRCVAVDGSGNVYVADALNDTIRKITPEGLATTLAGSPGLSGSANGTGAAARFDDPAGVAVDGSGNVYVADLRNDTIRKITPVGLVTTLAGSPGQSGSTDGTGSAARFDDPDGVAVDGSGNVYVSEWTNSTVRKITPEGSVTTLAGSPGQSGNVDDTGSAARFHHPSGVATDTSGNVYIADTGNITIRKITPGGLVTTLSGWTEDSGSADGTGSAAPFLADPVAVAVDGTDGFGAIYVADNVNNTIWKMTSTGVVTILAGSPRQTGSDDGTGTVARFDGPEGVAVNESGTVYVADWASSTIRKITPDGLVTTLAGWPGSSGSEDGTGTAARFAFPEGVAADGFGNVYVADWGNCTIRRITPEGLVTTVAGSPGQTGSADGVGFAALFDHPFGIAVDAFGTVYISDAWNNTIRKITPDGAVTTLAGWPGQTGSTDGTGLAARFDNPKGVAMDGAGNIYVADTGNSAIRKISPAGVVTTLPGFFRLPWDVATDVFGNVYVADTMDNIIQKITPEGTVTTVVGTDEDFGTIPGPLPASLYQPTGVAFDPTTGGLFVTVQDAVLKVLF